MTERKLKPTRMSKMQTIILRQVAVIPPSPTRGFECFTIISKSICGEEANKWLSSLKPPENQEANCEFKAMSAYGPESTQPRL